MRGTHTDGREIWKTYGKHTPRWEKCGKRVCLNFKCEVGTSICVPPFHVREPCVRAVPWGCRRQSTSQTVRQATRLFGEGCARSRLAGQAGVISFRVFPIFSVAWTARVRELCRIFMQLRCFLHFDIFASA